MSENIALMAAIASGEQKPRSHAPTAIPASSLTDVPDELTIRRNGEIETAKRRRLAPGDIIEIEGLGSYEVTRD